MQKIKSTCYLCMFIWAMHAGNLCAQQAQIFLDLQINPSLARSQVVNITHLISTGRTGSDFFNFFLQNENPARKADNLYFNIQLYSRKEGLLMDLYQVQGHPFSLDPAQQVYAASNSITNNLPGIEEDIDFEGGLTHAGGQFINNLGGSVTLLPGVYTIRVNIFQGNNGRNDGVLVASAETKLGSNNVGNIRDIFLTSPGNIAGSGAEITNPYPVFRWQGSRGVTYRLVVVGTKGQNSPESLLQGALSTAPIIINGNSSTGMLLDYEFLDARLKKTSYQYPPSGVQALEPGRIYYWQVITELTTSDGTETRASEIWSFTLVDQDMRQASGELDRVLKQLLGNDRFQQLQNGGFHLESLTVDGEVVTGTTALQKLMELKDKLEQGEISVIVDS